MIYENLFHVKRWEPAHILVSEYTVTNMHHESSIQTNSYDIHSPAQSSVTRLADYGIPYIQKS